MREIGMAAAEPRDREFEKLVARYWRDIVRRAIWLGVAERDAEDIAQDVFVVALEKCAAHKGRAWINEVCRRRTANYRKRFRHTYEEIDHEVVSLAVDEPDDAEARAALVDGVRRVLDALGEGERELLLRHDLEGETLRELAAWMGVTKSGAHARLVRAREVFLEGWGTW